jgi:curved DNA-binding protein CbpA
MARPTDPYRTLGITRGATLDDVKAAYRRLAKLYHPDSAGERAVERFLAIQAAYESLTEGPARLRLGTSRRATSAPPRSRRTAEPDSERGRASRSSSAGARSSTGGTRAGTGGTSGTRAGGSAGSSAGASGSTSSGPRPRRDRRKPTSTSYDGAEFEPFEPEWEGASWYGGSSGTYWTINPKEFADPRKHGPEYQARGRHAAAAEAAEDIAGAVDVDRPRRPDAARGAADDAPNAARGRAAHRSTEARPGAQATASAADPAVDRGAEPVVDPVAASPNGHSPSFRTSAARFVRGITGTRRGT